MKIEVLEPHGFCAGVTAALKKAQSLEGKIYCLHELVHNELVVGDLKKRGFVFVESVEEVPEGSTVLFSAHGVSPAVRASAERRGLKVVDATCPFVDRVHRAARAFAERGLSVVVIGNPSHVEVKGIVGEVKGDCTVISDPNTHILKHPNTPLGVVSQTTMNADEVARIVADLKRDYAVETMAEVCHATRDRQNAVKAFRGDALLVLGSSNSSNTKRLCEVANSRTFRAGTMEELAAIDFSGIGTLGVTSGASTPESFFTQAVERLKGL